MSAPERGHASSALGRSVRAEHASRVRPWDVEDKAAAVHASPTRAGTPASAGSLPAQDAAVPLGQLLRQAARAVKVGVPGAVWVMAAVAAIKPARGGQLIELVEPDVPRTEAGLLRSYLPDGVIEALRRSTGHAISVGDLVGMTIVVRLEVELHPRWGFRAASLASDPESTTPSPNARSKRRSTACGGQACSTGSGPCQRLGT